MGDEPAVGAEVEPLEGRSAVGADSTERLDHRLVGERARRAGCALGLRGGIQASPEPVSHLALGAGDREQGAAIGSRPVGGDGARQLALRRSVGHRVHDRGQVPAPGSRRERIRALRVVSCRRARFEQPAQVVEQRGGRLGGAVLIAVAIGQAEAAARQGEAGVEQIALLRLAVAARLQPQRGALLLGEEGVGRALAAGELALLEGSDEDVVETGGAQAPGVGDPYPVLDRAGPDPHPDRRYRAGERRRRRGRGRGAAPARPSRWRSRRRRAAPARRRRGRPSRWPANRPRRSAPPCRRRPPRSRARSPGSSAPPASQSARAPVASCTRRCRSSRSKRSTLDEETAEGPRR